MSCDAVQERLDELALARVLDGSPEHADLVAHARGCADCDAHLRFLHGLAAAFAAPALEPVSESVVASARERAVRVLRARETPSGVGRELVAAMAAALLALPLVVGHAYLMLEGGAWLLASWLPAPLLTWLGFAYLASLAIGVGALYGMIPVAVALRRRAVQESA